MSNHINLKSVDILVAEFPNPGKVWENRGLVVFQLNNGFDNHLLVFYGESQVNYRGQTCPVVPVGPVVLIYKFQ